MEQENTGKTVAFFYITSNGAVSVRKPGDYIAKAIDLAGGVYVFHDLPGEENALSTMNMQMESFYQLAVEEGLRLLQPSHQHPVELDPLHPSQGMALIAGALHQHRDAQALQLLLDLRIVVDHGGLQRQAAVPG